MPIIGIDLTAVGVIPDGSYVGTVSKLEYQISIADKTDGSGKPSWKNENRKTVDFETWKEALPNRARLHYTITIPGKGAIFHDLYMMDSALGFVQTFMKACGVEYSADGFDPEAAVGKQVGIEVTTVEDEYGLNNEFKFSKV